MTTVTLKSPVISVSLPEGFSEEQLLSFSPFNNWLETLTRSLSLQHNNSKHPFHEDPYALRSITVQSYDLFGGKRVGFLKLQAKVTNSAGESLPGAVFLRGPSVGMLMMLIPDDVPSAAHPQIGENAGLYDEERYVILTIQPRIPAGSLAFPELPAGMVDDDATSESGEGKFAGTAAREIYEELGIEIPASELVCLSDLAAGNSRASQVDEEEGLPSAMYPSAGGCDEYVPLYIHERRVPRDTLKEWTGKLTGLRDHGEKITLKLVPLRDLWREGRRDAKALAALALWEGLRREGKLQ
ncbi:hypothetical protein E0Z10_g5383 [Xylaria hypoxylon]|uniref:Nudix hydrolase domain-containing protein n=1 Tax=Xylaria hypoxylon TaxID=37992 RepID=A0A4Z0Z3X4_9PEZI|nr:hypothetical protein E0Z10_g5383 [Xylaria hypoxylon]